jgi:hypothetical protein
VEHKLLFKILLGRGRARTPSARGKSKNLWILSAFSARFAQANCPRPIGFLCDLCGLSGKSFESHIREHSIK